MCEIKIALSKLSEKNFSRKWPSLWEKTIDTLENRVVKLPCRRSMIPESRMWLWTFWWIERINAKLNLSPRFRVGVRFDTVRESACMACKRSAVRSRYSPPKKHCTSFEVRCFSFCFIQKQAQNQQADKWHPHFAGAWMQPPISDAALFLKMLVSILTAL